MSSPPPPPPPSLSAVAHSSPPVRLSNTILSKQNSTLKSRDESRSQSQAPNDNNNDNDNADDDNHSLPATPPPEPVNLWTEDEAMKLVAFLSTSKGPLVITDIAEHTDCPITHAAAMTVLVWYAAIGLAERRGSRVAWWAGRPLFNGLSLRRSVVLTVKSGIVVLVFYGIYDTDGMQVSIERPEQMYEADQFPV
ncbi:hypothetical protein CGRA01v4_15119 [Colletotrichum graminicola]|uniref:Uncharacterized protein n=1 Tax=Colletotrichum graminicola (strain M1.001 / M2 / FGSC 10212) TaxID=645133 RepID=E3QYZ5_COLGM|nr:uncharacterized protein GLRG_11227 [Colletotrichum graminicola M1.001]EFQ36083.1 hypothetical protein GLRG_11227 [Colletotrichum graminicola M1.001]WDK23826.1 hypothetical protein CGRA01v4_15119 [Colletotrichum graminicola]